MSLRRAFSALLLMSLTTSSCLTAQAIAKTVNPVPLERPSPITSVHTSNAALTLREIRDSTIAAGFKVTRFDQGRTYADFFAKTSSVYTSIVGVIVGFYFGRSTEGKPVVREGATPVPDKVP